jgi:hypothetical protein
MVHSSSTAFAWDNLLLPLSLVSLGVADTCVDDPDARMLAIANHIILSLIEYEFVQLYVGIS